MAKSCSSVFVTWAAFVWAISIATSEEFQPLYDEAELRGPGNARYERVVVEREPRRTHDAGGIRFAVVGDRIDILADRNGEETRQVRSTDGRKLRLLGTARHIALFAAENSDDELKAGRYHLPAEIRRCDLDTASWLPAWKIENADDAPSDVVGPALGAVLANDETVVALTYDKPAGVVVPSGPLRSAKTA